MQIVDALSAWRLRGVLAIGVESRPLLEMEVGVERMGLVVCAGLNPIAAAEKPALRRRIGRWAAMFEYRDLEPIG